jgi:hypothetical protein
MNCPRRFFASAINVWRSGVNHQQLISGYFVPMPRDFAPTLAIGAINKNHFRAPIFSHTSVTFGFWIIAGIRRQQMLEQGLFQSGGQDWTRHHNQPLSGKTSLFFTPFHAREFSTRL